jgi:hypothetical protein
MKKVLMTLCLVFVIVSTRGEHIYLKASQDMLTGTDMACQLYWEEVWDYLENFQYVHIVNKNWIPSPRIITYNYNDRFNK